MVTTLLERRGSGKMLRSSLATNMLVAGMLLALMLTGVGCNTSGPDEASSLITDVLASDIVQDSVTFSWTPDRPKTLTWKADEPIIITWTTDEPATSQVEYGETTKYGLTTPLDENLVLNHSVRLDYPGSASIIHFRVRSIDANGDEAVSGDYTYGWCHILADAIPRICPYDVLIDAANRLPESYWRNIDGESLTAWAERALAYHSPDINRRRDALFLAFDMATIASENKGFSPLKEHRARATRTTYGKLEESKTVQGLVIFKLYNEGTIIKTPDISFGVDIVLDDSTRNLAPGFARMLDALFITHTHRDHYDTSLIREFEKAGKPVVLAEDDSSLSLGGVTASGTIGNLQWTAFQGAHLNMVFSGFFHFQVGEWSILHSGDNTRWTHFVESEYAKNLDIFFFKPESVYGSSSEFQSIQEALEETLGKMRPKLVIPHHLLEIGHGLTAYGHDMGVRLYYQVPPGIEVQMLHWGESIVIPPGKLQDGEK